MKTLQFFKLPKFFYVIFFILFFSVTTFSQVDDSLYYTNPNYQVAKELFNKRIVMLADYSHSSSCPYRRLLNTCNNWLKICNDNAKNFNLTLVIEWDEQLVYVLNNWISSGNMKPILDKMSPNMSLQDLEYCEMLRSFSQKVDSNNQKSNYKLSFKIVGFEPTGDSNFLNDLSRKTQKESELWFINTRDSVVASKIIEYTQRNPGEQILIFYGAAHLQNGLVDKNLGFKDITKEESMGYYLSYYLKKQYGNTSVITIYPINYYRANLNPLFKDPILESKRNKEFIFKPQNLIFPVYNDTVNDYIINMHEKFNPPIFLNYICSRYIFEKTLERINWIKNSLPGYKALNDYKRCLRGAKLLTGINFDNDTDFNDWSNKNTYDGTDWLYSNKLTDTLEKLIIKNKDQRFINSIISLYGISFVEDSDIINFDKWKENKLPEILRQIKFTNSIGIYWFGYPYEQVKAKEYLKEFSGEDFQEPEKYLQWYRMKYYGVE
jgi:hypothetical protein